MMMKPIQMEEASLWVNLSRCETGGPECSSVFGHPWRPAPCLAHTGEGVLRDEGLSPEPSTTYNGLRKQDRSSHIRFDLIVKAKFQMQKEARTKEQNGHQIPMNICAASMEKALPFSDSTPYTYCRLTDTVWPFVELSESAFLYSVVALLSQI